MPHDELFQGAAVAKPGLIDQLGILKIILRKFGEWIEHDQSHLPPMPRDRPDATKAPSVGSMQYLVKQNFLEALQRCDAQINFRLQNRSLPRRKKEARNF